MELVKVVAKSSFVSPVVGSVNRKQELHISKEYAEFLAGLNLVDYPQKQVSVTGAGEVTRPALSPVETASPTTTLESPKKGRGRPAGKQS